MWLYEIYSVNSGDEYLCSLIVLFSIRIFKISQFNIFKQSNITYFSIIFNTLHNYKYQGERTQSEQGIRAKGPRANRELRQTDPRFAMLDLLIVK